MGYMNYACKMLKPQLRHVLPYPSLHCDKIQSNAPRNEHELLS